MSDLTARVASWLAGVGCRDIRPVRVTIGAQTWEGCRYLQERKTPENCRAWDEGQRTYDLEAIYLVGGLPRAYEQDRRLALTLAGDSREWYVGAFATVQCLVEPYAQYHPFGLNVMLMPWEVPSGDKIDYREGRRYRRLPLTVEYLEENAA